VGPTTLVAGGCLLSDMGHCHCPLLRATELHLLRLGLYSDPRIKQWRNFSPLSRIFFYSSIGMKILEFHRDGIISTDSSPFKMYQVAHTPTVTSHILLVFGGVDWSQSVVCSSRRMAFWMEFCVCAKLVFCWMEFSKNPRPRHLQKRVYAPPHTTTLPSHHGRRRQ